jgi:hypothetical protein
MAHQFKRLSHSLCECKYHIVFCPKYRFRLLKDEFAEYVRQQIDQLCRQKSAGHWLLEPMQQAMRDLSFAGMGTDLKLVMEQSGTETWARGAACVVLSHLFASLPTIDFHVPPGCQVEQANLTV